MNLDVIFNSCVFDVSDSRPKEPLEHCCDIIEDLDNRTTYGEGQLFESNQDKNAGATSPEKRCPFDLFIVLINFRHIIL